MMTRNNLGVAANLYFREYVPMGIDSLRFRSESTPMGIDLLRFS